MDPVIEEWFARRTWQEPPLDASTSWSRRRPAGGCRSCCPALDEEATVGAIVAAIVPLTRGPAPLVDELVVIDSGSTDRTVEVAAAAGRAGGAAHRRAARARRRCPARARCCGARSPPPPATSSATSTPTWSTSTPASCRRCSARCSPSPASHLVKGFYRRPLRLETTQADTGGGRVTELLVRPLLAALRPELAGIVQPLGGEYAGTRELLESVPFAAGYGVEIGLLLDTHAACGLDALAQVNLGVRKHRNRSLLQLGVMARQILAAALARCATSPGRGRCADPVPAGRRRVAAVVHRRCGVTERPPMREVLVRCGADRRPSAHCGGMAVWGPR